MNRLEAKTFTERFKNLPIVDAPTKINVIGKNLNIFRKPLLPEHTPISQIVSENTNIFKEFFEGEVKNIFSSKRSSEFRESFLWGVQIILDAFTDNKKDLPIDLKVLPVTDKENIVKTLKDYFYSKSFMYFDEIPDKQKELRECLVEVMAKNESLKERKANRVEDLDKLDGFIKGAFGMMEALNSVWPKLHHCAKLQASLS